MNARGTFLVAKAVLPGMIAAGSGAIINISSAAGKDGVATAAHYSASKFAVIGFTQSLAREVAGAGIRVNAVCPGVVPTQMIADVAAPGTPRRRKWWPASSSSNGRSRPARSGPPWCSWPS